MSEEETIYDIKRILAVDDHEMTAIGYKFVLENAEFDGYGVQVDTCNNFEQAEQRIKKSETLYRYDIFLLDIQLFGPETKDSRTGEDLGKLARQVAPSTKLVYMSSFGDAFRIRSICKSTNPDGYMVKSEIDEASLIDMVEKVLHDPPYYTAQAMKVLRKHIANNDSLDEIDNKILYHISKGVRTKDIGPLLSVSLHTIETRKRKIKSLFQVEDGNDFNLIEVAREKGFI